MQQYPKQKDYIAGGTQKDYYGKNDVEKSLCPLCNSGDFIYIYTERGNLGIVKCKSCTLIYTNPKAKDSTTNFFGDINTFYEEARLIFSGRKKHHRDRNYIYELRKIKRFTRSGRFLDIGVCQGCFLARAREFGYEVEGIEASPALAQIARKEFGLTIKNCFFEESDYPADSFDIITMLDVFEHVANPHILLQKAHKALKNDGILCIKVPNGRYNLLKLKLARLFRREAKHDIFDSCEHLMHLTPETMKSVLGKNGFRIKKLIIPIPIHPPVWPVLVGRSFAFASPFVLDWKNSLLRILFRRIGQIEKFFGLKIWFAPDLMFIIEKAEAFD